MSEKSEALNHHTGSLGLVRHGQTHANVSKVWHGQTDTELTDLGHQQALHLGRHFPNYMDVDVIYASPLQRARLTAEAIGKQFKKDVVLDPRLMEFHLGDWEGMTYDALEAHRESAKLLHSDPDFRAPNGESVNSVRERMIEAVDEITTRHWEENIILVAHGVSLAILIAHIVDGDSLRWTDYGQHNTAFSQLCLNTRSLIHFNRIDHLEA
ncbi:MAG: histidine phosphatase family protein [bacterium]